MSPNVERELAELKQGDHVGLIYQSIAELLAVTVPFIKDGIARGERCVCIVDDRKIQQIVEALERAGVNVEHERRRGALWLLTPRDTYLGTGEFATNSMIALIRRLETEARADGFSALRLAGEPSWSVSPEPGSDRLIEYEALLNHLPTNSKSLILCMYNRARFSTPCIHDILRTHPVVILGDQVCPNSYYESPQTVLSKDEGAAAVEVKAKRVDWWIAQLQRRSLAEQERERALQELRQSERRLAEAQQVAHIGSWERDLRTNVVTWSDELYRLFGLQAQRGDVPYQRFLELILPQDTDRVRTLVEEAIHSRGQFSCDYHITRPDGSVRVLHDQGGVVLDDNGDPIRLVGTAQDVTERRKAEDTLRESQQLLQNVLDTLPVGVLVTDRAADVILANPASERIWGEIIVSGRERWARSKGFKHDTGEKVDPENWASARALREGQTTLNELIDIETFDGERKTIQNSAGPIRNTEGLIIGAVVVNEDVTEQIRAQKALGESADHLQHLSRRLLAVQEDERRHLARELHDEVGQLLTGLQMLLNPKGNSQTDAVNATFEQARTIVNDLLERVRGLSFDLRPAVLDQLGLIPALLELFENYTKRTGVLVSFKHKDVENRFAAEVETTAYRIVQEALTNAARHAGVVAATVRVWATNDLLSVQIEDRGRGFDAEAALATPRSSGLAGMRERVLLMHGQLTIDSQPGDGAEITAEIPLGRPTG